MKMIIFDPSMSDRDEAIATIYEIDGKHGLRELRGRSYLGDYAGQIKWMLALAAEYPGSDFRVETNGCGAALLEEFLRATGHTYSR